MAFMMALQRFIFDPFIKYHSTNLARIWSFAFSLALHLERNTHGNKHCSSSQIFLQI